MKWFEKGLCRERRACVDCRKLRTFRESLFRKGWVESPDFACPKGIDETTAQAAVEKRIVAIVRKKGCGTCKPVVVVSPS